MDNREHWENQFLPTLLYRGCRLAGRNSEDEEQNQSPVSLVVAAGRGKGGGQETLWSSNIRRAGCLLELEVGLYDRLQGGTATWETDFSPPEMRLF